MKFCIDETSLTSASGNLQDISDALESLAENVQRCRAVGDGTVERCSLLDEVEVAPGIRLTDDLLYGDRLDRDLRLLLQQVLNRCVVWDSNETDLPAPAEVEIQEKRLESFSIARAHDRAGRGEAIALLVLPSSGRSGSLPVRRGEVIHQLHFVSEDASLTGFLRSVPEIEDLDAVRYVTHAARIFTGIHFVEGLVAQCGHFSRPFRDLRPTVTAHLVALNDHFQDILHRALGEPRQIMAELKARCGIDASPENSNTKSNPAAWRTRKIVVDGREVWCDWHTKLHPQRDRIHFYPGRADLVSGRLIVGIFHQHLPL